MSKIELLSSVLSGFTAGFTVLVLEQIYIWYKEKRLAAERLIVKATPLNKRISQQALNRLRPGTSIDNMRSMLGAPVVSQREVFPIFTEHTLKKYSYLYFFSNADIKITTFDNETIDSLTIIFKDEIDGGIGFTLFPFQEKESSNVDQLKLDEDFNLDRYEHIKTRVDNATALQTYVPNPLHSYYTVFVHNTDNPLNFSDHVIEGICISSKKDDVYYIYDMERRVDI